MSSGFKHDAVVVGAGPNGLSAAVTLAQAGLSVLLVEARESLGGGCRTAELTLPGFHHDVCAAIHPMGALSPAFARMELEKHGLSWAQTPAPLAHPLDDNVAVLNYSVDETAAGLGRDGRAWKDLMQPFIERKDDFFRGILKPIRIPSNPFLMMRFGLVALRSSESFVRRTFTGDLARALFTGCAAHAILPLDAAGTASFGLVLALAGHAIGWPCAVGGSARIIEAMEKCFRGHGGSVQTNCEVRSLSDLPESRIVLFDLPPRHVAGIAGADLPHGYASSLRKFRYGPGVFKVDWALDGAIPWRNEECLLAATVHVCGTAEEVMQSEHEMGNGKAPEKPFVLVAQQSLFDSSRAPAGKQTGWAYCHVPPGCDVDMTERIENQIERFAPGFKDRILARHARSPAEYERYNANMIGGDLGGGANDLRQFMFRPVMRWDPYSTPNPRLFICSSSTPPGGGVHGMCGYWAARSALKRRFGVELPKI